MFALARTLLCAYRAAHQSITVDEATTYLNYVRGHWSNVWGPYDPNNHVLFSILAQISVRLFHISELSLRLPTVVAGFFFVIGFHRVLERTVESRAVRILATATVSLAPLLLDFSVAARGYGLGITLLVWAVYFSIRGRDLWAGIFAGLAMSATFNLAFSVLGIVLCPLLLGAGRWRARLRRVNRVFEPAAIVLLIICYPVIRQAQKAQFYVGTPSLKDALYDFVVLSIRALPGRGGWLGSPAIIFAIEYLMLPAVLVLMLGIAVRLYRRDRKLLRILAPALALILALASTGASHIFLHLNYPEDRLTLALFVLLALAWAVAIDHVRNRHVRWANGLIAVALAVQFLHQFHLDYFTVWQVDAGIRPLALRLRDEVKDKPARSVSVSATWYYFPSLEFYRSVYNIGALQPVERHDPAPLEGFDYYVLSREDLAREAAHSPGAIPIFRDNFSGVELLK